jgi:hypothetical protein
MSFLVVCLLSLFKLCFLWMFSLCNITYKLRAEVQEVLKCKKAVTYLSQKMCVRCAQAWLGTVGERFNVNGSAGHIKQVSLYRNTHKVRLCYWSVDKTLWPEATGRKLCNIQSIHHTIYIYRTYKCLYLPKIQTFISQY